MAPKVPNRPRQLGINQDLNFSKFTEELVDIGGDVRPRDAKLIGQSGNQSGAITLSVDQLPRDRRRPRDGKEVPGVDPHNHDLIAGRGLGEPVREFG
jgi:hypothetical protein